MREATAVPTPTLTSLIDAFLPRFLDDVARASLGAAHNVS
jgi:hypothetical protein